MTTKQYNQKLIKNGKPALHRPALAKMFLDTEKKKEKSKFAGYPLWKLEKNLTDICPRGRTPKSK